MKHLITATVFFFLFSFNLAAQALDNYTLDPNHSFVQWDISHFGFSKPSGKWMANGTIQLDEAKPQNSKVNITINLADIVTGVPKLDEHLKDKDFFNTKNFPTATFVSDKIEMTGKKSAKVHGMLTLHGMSKPIILNVTLNKIANNPMTNKKSLGVTATTTIKRSEFDIKKYLPDLGDEVEIKVEAEASISK